MSTIDRVEIHGFTYEVQSLGLPEHGAQGSATGSTRRAARSGPAATPCASAPTTALRRIRHPLVGTPSAMAQSIMLAPHLLGRDPRAASRSTTISSASCAPTTTWATARSTSRCGTSPARSTARRSRVCWAVSYPPADLRQHLSRPGRAGRSGQPGGVRRLRRSLQRARLHGLQDPRLARRRPPARGEEPAVRARRRRHGADDRSGVRAAHLHGRAHVGRVRRGAVLLVRGPVPRRRGLCLPQRCGRS